MANVRCPMCSKVNAPDAPVCAFCGARLKPLGPGESASQAPASRPDDDEPEWMLGLRGDEPSAASGGAETTGGAGAEANEDADLPDWLARIRGRAQTESGGSEFGAPEETFGGQEEAQAGGLPDWLGQQGGAEAQEPAAESTADDDWLTRLQNADSGGLGSSQPPDFSSTNDFSSGSEQDASLNWLQQPPAEDQAAAAPPFDVGSWGEKPAEAEQPAADDWMSTFSSWTPETAQESETPAAEPAVPSDDLSGFGLTGFLSNFETGEEKPPETPPAVETGSSGFGLTGFLSSLEGGEEQPPAQPQEEATSSGFGLTGFLSSLETGSDQPAASDEGWEPPASSAPAAGSEASLPDWLSGGEPAQAASDPGIPSGTTGDLSSWLTSLEGEQPQEPAARAAEQPAEGLPGWLAAAGQESAPAAPQESQPEQVVPGWLSETPLEPPAIPSETAHLGEDVPEWLADVPAPVAGAAPLPDWLAGSASADQEAFSTEFVPQEADAPDADAQEAATPEVGAPEPPSVAEPVSTGPTPFIDEDAPAWLRDFAAEGPAETEGAGISPLLEAEDHPQMQAESEQPFAVDLPDWLEEDAARASASEGAAEAIPSEDLARAELPSWVAAMRPVESSVMPGDTAAQDTDQYVEKAGPLSGMRGVLPIAENLIRYRKPPIYSLKLHTTEKQRNQAALLDSIIAQESQPLLIPPARSQAPHLIMRIVIALILVAVIALPNLMQMFGMPFDPLSMPALQPVELEEMYNRINQGAQPGEEYTVLLAFDYEPGFSGEMSAAASPVISHLMAQNAQLVVVSTTPSGPAMADRLLREVAAAGAVGYSVDSRAVNLGFLPGGTISLLEFVRQPQFAAPATVNGEMAWEQTFLSGIDRFEDFSQVIVLTDSAETGRAWVEQIWPQSREVPLFMIASAQAAPMLIPYLNAANLPDSGQIDGMVSGLMGGAQYGWFAGQVNNPASRYWASYQIGIVLAVVLVLAGGLISGIRRLMSRDEKGEA